MRIRSKSALGTGVGCNLGTSTGDCLAGSGASMPPSTSHTVRFACCVQGVLGDHEEFGYMDGRAGFRVEAEWGYKGALSKALQFQCASTLVVELQSFLASFRACKLSNISHAILAAGTSAFCCLHWQPALSGGCRAAAT